MLNSKARKPRSILRRLAVATLAMGMAVIPNLVPLQAHAALQLRDKVGCFELLWDTTKKAYWMENVCANRAQGTWNYYTTITSGGQRLNWCIGHKQRIYLGQASEFAWSRNANASGCTVRSKPWFF